MNNQIKIDLILRKNLLYAILIYTSFIVLFSVSLEIHRYYFFATIILVQFFWVFHQKIKKRKQTKNATNEFPLKQEILCDIGYPKALRNEILSSVLFLLVYLTLVFFTKTHYFNEVDSFSLSTIVPFLFGIVFIPSYNRNLYQITIDQSRIRIKNSLIVYEFESTIIKTLENSNDYSIRLNLKDIVLTLTIPSTEFNVEKDIETRMNLKENMITKLEHSNPKLKKER